MLGVFWNDRPNEKCLPLAYINDSSDFVNTTTNSLNHFFIKMTITRRHLNITRYIVGGKKCSTKSIEKCLCIYREAAVV
jgi:hypothetical protein